MGRNQNADNYHELDKIKCESVVIRWYEVLFNQNLWTPANSTQLNKHTSDAAKLKRRVR